MVVYDFITKIFRIITSTIATLFRILKLGFMIPKEIFRLLFKIFAILEETVGMILELFEEPEAKPVYRDDGKPIGMYDFLTPTASARGIQGNMQTLFKPY
ncbi:Oidioi.mRNA.OKI2018_I69.chr2.g7296.t1.cds [Oikopleura dioica]|uniref:Oidioi.mRNA.OKI2018_I69.chr2.g7296.t1.cds n=1 Tax=Oikopleura dioica TaxID=34765 RepID=A0ABN7T9F3_OIKDI|nr:Oidioi.mRNA.OKI2018_I69.chr2.g7296.t1.cds [Oikopleura dioica]